MKIIAKKRHSNFKQIYKFENKRELLEYAKERKNNCVDSISELEEKFNPNNNKTIYELLDFCNLEKIN